MRSKHSKFSGKLRLFFWRTGYKLPLAMGTMLKSALEHPTSTFQWLRTGEEALTAMLGAIRSASESIRLETYIFYEGPLANQFRDELTAAAQRGLKVQVMIDSMGSIALSDAYWQSFRQAGGRFIFFNPLSLNRWSYRDHRKLMICDEKIAFIGGFNIADEYRGDGVKSGWRDLGLQIAGPLVRELTESFDQFFTNANMLHKRLQNFRPAQDKVTLGQNWKLLLNGPGLNHAALKRSFVQDLRTARNVKIICAYFLPTWRLRKALLSVAKRGGKVQLILAGKSDVLLSHLATRRLYRLFLRSGVEIYEYQPQVLHAKLFIMDDVVYAGSANMDVRSLRINYELLVRVSDPGLAAGAREMFTKDLTHCLKIDPVAWRKSRNFLSKLKENWAYFVLARVDPYLARRQLKYLR